LGAEGIKGAGLLIVWIFYAPFWLLFNAYIDVTEFIKILLNTQEEVDEIKEQNDRDKIIDKICIYNEVIDTMRATMTIFQEHYQKKILDFEEQEDEEEEDKEEPKSP
jgi:hypothetical protein